MFSPQVIKLMKLERNLEKFSHIKWILDELGEWDFSGNKDNNTLEISFKTRINPYVLTDIVGKYLELLYDDDCRPIVDFDVLQEERFYVHIAISGVIL